MRRSGGMSDNAQGNQPKSIRFTLPLLPPSCNALHQVIWSQRKVELKPEVRLWRSKVKRYVPRFELESETSLLRVDVIFHYPFYARNGSLRVRDTHNMVKPLVDVIAEKQGWDDKRAKRGSWDSVDDVDESVVVVLSEIGA